MRLERKKVVLCVRIGVRRRRRRHSGNRRELREINVRIRMRYGSIERRKHQRKWVDAGLATGRSEGRGEQWSNRAGVAQSVGRLRLIECDRVPLYHRIEYSIARPDA